MIGWIIVAILLVIAVCAVIVATLMVKLYLRTQGVNLQMMEMDMFALWSAKENGNYQVPRARR